MSVAHTRARGTVTRRILSRFPAHRPGSVRRMAEDRLKNQDDEDLPGNVSDQNAEEQPPEHEGHRETRRGGAGGDTREGGSGGESSEGSQSTGSPNSAG